MKRRNENRHCGAYSRCKKLVKHRNKFVQHKCDKICSSLSFFLRAATAGCCENILGMDRMMGYIRRGMSGEMAVKGQHMRQINVTATFITMTTTTATKMESKNNHNHRMFGWLVSRFVCLVTVPCGTPTPCFSTYSKIPADGQFLNTDGQTLGLTDTPPPNPLLTPIHG